MKKILGIILAAMMIVTAFAMVVSAENELSVQINGQKIEFDILPQIIEGRTMVPLRKIFEALGATVNWDDATKTVSSEMNGHKISLTIGINKITIDGVDKELDVPAQIFDSRTLVPVRAITEAFGCEVGWDGETRTVSLTVKASDPEAVEIKEIEGAVITMANAEPGSEKYVFIGGGCKLGVVIDSDDPTNHVYYANATVTDKQNWTYIWYDTSLKPGQRYVVDYDCKAVSDAFGDEIEGNAFIGTCFKYGTAENSTPADHGVGGNTLFQSNKWYHTKVIYTVPENAVEAGSRFGIYANPLPKNGLDHNVAIGFMIDNLSVVPYTGDDADGVVGTQAGQAKASDFDFDNVKGVVYDFNTGDDGWKFGNCTGEVKDGVYVVTPDKNDNPDPQIFVSGVSIDAATHKMVAVKFKYNVNNDNTKNCNMFFTTDTDEKLDEAKCRYVDYATGKMTDDGYTWLLFDFSLYKQWKGTITKFRFDPANGCSGTFEIDKIVVIEL